MLKWTPKAQRAWLAKVRRNRVSRARTQAQAETEALAAPDPQTRLTKYYRRKIVPRELARLKGPAVAGRGTRFARDAAQRSRRQRCRQASLRDMGWSHIDDWVHPPASPQAELLPEGAGGEDAGVENTGDAVGAAGGASYVSAPPHPALARACHPLTAREEDELLAWQEGPTAPVGFRDSGGREASLPRTTLAPLLTPTGHLATDILEAFQALFGTPPGHADCNHTAPYAASYHQDLLARPLGAPLHPQAAWTQLYREAIPALTGHVPAVGHPGICIPLHSPAHWVLLVLDVNDASFTVFDSLALGEGPSPHVVHAISHLQVSLSRVAEATGHTITWGATTAPPIGALARQYDIENPSEPGGDCLLFVGCWAACIASGATPDLHTIDQTHMYCVRRRLLHSLVACPGRNCKPRLEHQEPHGLLPPVEDQHPGAPPLLPGTEPSPPLLHEPAEHTYLQEAPLAAPPPPTEPPCLHIAEPPRPGPQPRSRPVSPTPPAKRPRVSPPQRAPKRQAPTHAQDPLPKKPARPSADIRAYLAPRQGRPTTRKRKPGEDPHAYLPPPKSPFNKSNSTQEQKQGHDPYG